MPDFAAQRLNMVEGQVRANDVTDRRIQAAMGQVQRERFVPGRLNSVAYMDRCLEVGPGRYLLDPRSFAKLLHLASIGGDERVLDVGCGSGYSSAVIAQIAAEVVALECNPELTEVARQFLGKHANVAVVNGPLAEGAPANAPFDVIVLNGAAEFIPAALFDQLSEGGRLVAIVSQGGRGLARLYVKSGGAVGERPAFDAQVPVLLGFEKAREFVF